MSQVSVSQLFFYPIKSCGGIELTRGFVTPKGFRLDRHWMVTDENGLFITQRRNPEMALVRPKVSEDSSSISIMEKSDFVEVPKSDDGEKLAPRAAFPVCGASNPP